MPTVAAHTAADDVPWRLPPLNRKSQILLIAAALSLGLANIVLTWSHIGLIWGDMGVWLHDAERFAGGELPYRDFHWPYPPVALWVVGFAGRLFGTDAAVFWTVTSAIFLAVLYLFTRYAAMLVPTKAALPVVLGGILLAIAVEDRVAMGMYTPAAPLGFLFLLAGILTTIRMLESGRRGPALVAGAAAALMILTKHDFWITALYLMAAACAVLWQSRRSNGKSLAVAMLGMFALVLCAGLMVIAFTAGPGAVLGIVGGGGQVTVTRGRAMPSGERLTLEAVILCLYAALVLAVTSLGRDGVSRWKRLKWPALFFGLAIVLTVFFFLMEGQHSQGSANAILLRLKLGIQSHLLPLLLPSLALAVLLLKWKQAPHPQRVAAALLLGLCVTARARRLFEYTEWFHFLLEPPVYAFVFLMFFPEPAAKVRRAVSAVCVGLVLLGAYSYWNMGVGAFTRRGRFMPQQTVRGRVYLEPEHVAAFRVIQAALDREDPGRNWPLFALGHSGGFNYFYGRTNPTPLTLGFWLSNFPADPVLAVLQNRAGPMFFLENHGFLNSDQIPSSRLHLLKWKLEMIPYPPIPHDHKYFQMLTAGCAEIERFQERRPTLVLYRCPGRAKEEGRNP